jgi:PAS domain S-box-containing protein
MVYTLSFSARNKAESARFYSQMPEIMRQQLQISENQLDSLSIHAYPEDQSDDAPLPRSLDEALKQTNRAIVITETVKPFRVVQVSKAWEGLCGFSSEESIGKSLGALLKGPETDPLTVTSLLAHLLRGEEAGAILTNYTKDKRRFRNRLRVGPMVENSKVTHYVGVLQEVYLKSGFSKSILR